MNSDEWNIVDIEGFVVLLHDVIHELHRQKQRQYNKTTKTQPLLISLQHLCNCFLSSFIENAS